MKKNILKYNYRVNSRNLSYFVFIAIFIVIGYLKPVYSVQWEQREKYKDVVSVKGTCETDVIVYLVPKNSEESVYSGGVRCEKGEFSYKDDLRQWNIPKGIYRLVIGKDNKKDFSHIEEVESTGEREVLPTVAPEVSKIQTGDDNPENRFAKGAENLYSTSNALTNQIGKMRQDLSQTSYPEPMKNILDSFLSVIESRLIGVFDGINKLIEMIIRPEEKKDEIKEVSPIPTEIPVSVLPQESSSSSELEETTPASTESAH